jgi:hypothetical protein
MARLSWRGEGSFLRQESIGLVIMGVTKRDTVAMALARDLWSAILNTEIPSPVMRELGTAYDNDKEFDGLPRNVKLVMLAVAYKMLPEDEEGEGTNGEKGEESPGHASEPGGNRERTAGGHAKGSIAGTDTQRNHARGGGRVPSRQRIRGGGDNAKAEGVGAGVGRPPGSPGVRGTGNSGGDSDGGKGGQDGKADPKGGGSDGK